MVDAGVGERGSDPGRTPLPVGVRWGVGAVSRRLGVAISTLRSWERRYGLGPSQRTLGGHRRYSERDIARIEQMSRLIGEGVPAAQAARLLVRGPVPPARRPVRQLTSTDDGTLLPAARWLRSPEMSRVLTRAMLGAARGLDRPLLAKVFNQVLDARGVVGGWTDVVVPFMAEVDARSRSRGIGVGAKHFVDECLAAELRKRVRHSREGLSTRPAVLLASVNGERRALLPLAVAAALSEHAIGTSLLGARPLAGAIAGAEAGIGPRVVLVWSSLTANGELASLREAMGSEPGAVLLLGGPGWDAAAEHRWWLEPVGRVERVADLRAAVDRIRDLVT